MRKTLIAGAIFLMAPLTILAAGNYLLLGDAVLESSSVRLVSDSSNDPAYGGIRLSLAEGMTFSSLTQLSFDFNVTDDDCGGGSPRMQVGFDLDDNPATPNKNIFIYAGPLPSFTGCTPDTWLPTGNFVGSPDLRFDSSQLGGPWYGSYADALTLIGDEPIARMSIVIDSSWIFPDHEQTVLIDNVRVNDTLIEFTDSDGDGVTDDGDNCPTVANADQADENSNGIGDACECAGRMATMVGTGAHDVLIGTAGDDVIAGGGGHDVIDGRGGNDVICGGDGHDVLRGGSGDDEIYGEAGKDVLLGESGADVLDGGADKDICKDRTDGRVNCEL